MSMFGDEEAIRRANRERVNARARAAQGMSVTTKDVLEMKQIERERKEQAYKRELGMKTDDSKGVRYQVKPAAI